jgi:glycosyltransferase involved in cell wall biosynthesis
MHVLYFHQHFTTPRGAGGTRSYEFARKLVERGHRVTMVCGAHKGCDTGLQGEPQRGARRGVVEGIDVVELQLEYSNHDSLLKRSVTFGRFALRSIWEALSTEHDLLFATSTPLTAAVPGIVAKLLKRQRFVFEVRDLWPELPVAMGVLKNPLVIHALALLEHMAYRTADACVALAPGIQEGIERHDIAHDRVAMIPNGCDLELFTPASGKRVPLPGVGADDFVAIFAGAHGLANGLGTALECAAALKRANADRIKLVFIGDGREKPQLVERAKREGLDNCVFLEPVGKKKMAEMMKSVDVGLMLLADIPAFYYGTSPNKFFDYLASGVAVLNNYPGWLAGLIGESGCGRVVPPRDGEAMARALIEMERDRESTRQMGRKARQLAEQQFDRDQLAENFVRVLESVVGAEAARTNANGAYSTRNGALSHSSMQAPHE